MNTDGTGFHTCKECHKTESLWNHTATDHKEGEQLEDRRSVGASSCTCGDGTDQRVQSLMPVMMMMMALSHVSCHPVFRFLIASTNQSRSPHLLYLRADKAKASINISQLGVHQLSYLFALFWGIHYRMVSMDAAKSTLKSWGKAILRIKGKGKTVPLQTCSGPEGSRKLRFPDFMAMAQDGGRFVSLRHRPPLPSGNAPGTHFC